MKYSTVERTLCLMDDDGNFLEAPKVTVVVSTPSAQSIGFSLVMYEVDGFSGAINEASDVTGVTVSTPAYRYVNLVCSGGCTESCSFRQNEIKLLNNWTNSTIESDL